MKMKKRKCFVSFANNKYIKSGHCLRDRFSKGFKFNKIKNGIAFS